MTNTGIHISDAERERLRELAKLANLACEYAENEYKFWRESDDEKILGIEQERERIWQEYSDQHKKVHGC